MTRSLFALSAVLLTLSGPVFAMSDDSSHYRTQGNQANLADPDEQDNFGNDAATSAASRAANGRREQLLGAMAEPQSYGSYGHSGNFTYGFSQGPTWGSFQSGH